jgi:hypothetical protein
MAGTYVAEPNTILLGHTIEEQAQIELNERGVWEPKLTVDGIENKLAATAFTADPAERFGYGLQLFPRRHPPATDPASHRAPRRSGARNVITRSGAGPGGTS